jgi:hypothetical protein
MSRWRRRRGTTCEKLALRSRVVLSERSSRRLASSLVFRSWPRWGRTHPARTAQGLSIFARLSIGRRRYRGVRGGPQCAPAELLAVAEVKQCEMAPLRVLHGKRRPRNIAKSRPRKSAGVDSTSARGPPRRRRAPDPFATARRVASRPKTGASRHRGRGGERPGAPDLRGAGGHRRALPGRPPRPCSEELQRAGEQHRRFIEPAEIPSQHRLVSQHLRLDPGISGAEVAARRRGGTDAGGQCSRDDQE